jgi:hypothetical protein
MTNPDGTSVSFSADYSCAQQFSDVAYSDGTVKPGQSNSPCLAVVPIVTTRINAQNQALQVESYALVFLAAAQKQGSSDGALAVQFVTNVEVQANLAAYTTGSPFVISLLA